MDANPAPAVDPVVVAWWIANHAASLHLAAQGRVLAGGLLGHTPDEVGAPLIDAAEALTLLALRLHPEGLDKFDLSGVELPLTVVDCLEWLAAEVAGWDPQIAELLEEPSALYVDLGDALHEARKGGA